MSAVKRWGGLGIAFACSFLVAGIGGALTDLGPWYFALKQPAWKPPDIAFGPIWTTIFTLCALSGWGAWQLATSFKQKLAIALMFGVNGALNVLWSWLYFTLKRPDWALWRSSMLSSLMIVPYLVWVTTAGFLNHSTIELNGPFGP